MRSFHFLLTRTGTMNRSCRLEPAGQTCFAKRPHAFTGGAPSPFHREALRPELDEVLRARSDTGHGTPPEVLGSVICESLSIARFLSCDRFIKASCSARVRGFFGFEGERLRVVLTGRPERRTACRAVGRQSQTRPNRTPALTRSVFRLKLCCVRAGINESRREAPRAEYSRRTPAGSGCAYSNLLSS